MNLRENIRQALSAKCGHDFLAVHRGLMAEQAWPESRPAFARLLEIIALLRAGRKFTATTLAARFTTSTKTIHRDVTFLRKFVTGEIRYIRNRHVYQLEGEFKFLSKEAA